MRLDNDILKLIDSFNEIFNEIDSNKICEFKIELVDNIYDKVCADDSDYAKKILGEKKKIFGLHYITSNNENVLYIENKQDTVNIVSTIIHEYVHLCDFYKLSIIREETDYRKLQEDTFFILWSEFHATYWVYRYLINLGKENIRPENVSEEIKSELTNYYLSSKKIDILEAVNKTVRIYGEYIALQEIYSERLEKYLKGLYLNENFLKVYDFLFEHRTFESMIGYYQELKELFENLEK